MSGPDLSDLPAVPAAFRSLEREAAFWSRHPGLKAEIDRRWRAHRAKVDQATADEVADKTAEIDLEALDIDSAEKQKAFRAFLECEIASAEERADAAARVALRLEELWRRDAEVEARRRLNARRELARRRPVPVFEPTPKPKAIIGAMTAVLAFVLVPLGVMRRQVKIELPLNYAERQQEILDRELYQNPSSQEINSLIGSKEVSGKGNYRAKEIFGNDRFFYILSSVISDPENVEPDDWYAVQMACDDVGPFLRDRAGIEFREAYRRDSESGLPMHVAAERLFPRLVRAATRERLRDLKATLDRQPQSVPEDSPPDESAVALTSDVVRARKL